MTPNGAELVRLVSDPTIVGDRDPAVLPDVLEPRLIGAVGWEEIVVPLDGQSGVDEDLWKALAEIAVGEKDKAQAARS